MRAMQLPASPRLRRVALPAAVGLLLGLAWSTPAAANVDIDGAKALFMKGDFRGALARLKQAEKSPALSEDELADLYWYRGAASFVLGRTPEATEAFDALLEVRPLHEPDARETP